MSDVAFGFTLASLHINGFAVVYLFILKFLEVQLDDKVSSDINNVEYEEAELTDVTHCRREGVQKISIKTPKRSFEDYFSFPFFIT